MIQFSKEYLRERIYACWLGKNIGGTLGGPYEWAREVLDIKGFSTKPGEPLPNDDLDLQLVWLRAVDQLGPEAINSKVLGEYWMTWIDPYWNEYGFCKANMANGIVPPISGEFDNEEWKHSNGAWIRTEVWASLYPAMPEKAIRMAYEDACVDHGYGEGTYAAIFIAAMQSMAFVIQDANTLLDIGLSKIPEDCRIARSVKLVRKAYAEGISWRECRQMLVEDSQDLGWFQAPANVGFVVLGLLYGEGDFKQSLLHAVNCGDDTDCTAATLGALLGIMGGMEAIPADWCEYIGDEIKTICITNGHGRFPKTCTELTDCIMNLLPVTLRQRNDAMMDKAPHIALGDVTVIEDVKPEDYCGRAFVDKMFKRKQYSFTVEGIYADALIEFDEKPVAVPNGTLTGKVTMLHHTLPGQRHYHLNFHAPEGWWVECAKSLFTPQINRISGFDYEMGKFIIHVGEKVEAVNRIILDIQGVGRPTSVLVPIQVMG